MMMALCPAIP